MAKEGDDSASVCLVDDLLALRARAEDQVPLIAYPRSKHDPLDYELFTARILDCYTDAAVKTLIRLGVSPASHIGSKTIAMKGPSTLEFIITMFAVSRLGYSVLILSPRLSVDACIALLDQVDCSIMLFAPSTDATASKIQTRRAIRSIFMLSRADFAFPTIQGPRFVLKADRDSARHKIAFIMHSSGSTGLPKPIFQTHGACMQNYAAGYGMRGLVTAPLYHTHGHAVLYRGIYQRCAVYLLNASLPVTSSYVLAAMQRIRPEVLFSVPYVLGLIAETKAGLESLASCKIVSSSGSPVPDELGNRIVANGGHLVSLFGATEIGVILNSMRERDDKDWAYMRLLPTARPFVLMNRLENSTYELIALDGLKSKVTSNSNDPPNSFHTRDIFEAHPTKPDRWKYIGRLDDRVTLDNGEKVLPLVIEGRLREEALVREAVVFGIGRSLPGLLLFRSQHAAHLSDQEFIARVWPAVEDANSHSESFSQITKETILPMSADVDYPMTDKGTFIRPQIYKAFERDFNFFYEKLENNAKGTLRLDQTAMERFIMQSFQEECSVYLATRDTDFFLAGADSLKAAQIAGIIKRQLYLGKNSKAIGPDTIFQQANTARLAKYLVNFANNVQDAQQDGISTMRAMIKKYTVFGQPCQQKTCLRPGRSVILTGATGSLGVHILAQLLQVRELEKIYCLVRASSAESAKQRVCAALSQRGLKVSKGAYVRIICCPSDLSKADFGIDSHLLANMRGNVSLIIHTAWAVNFNLSLSSFEEQHIRGTYNLLNFGLSVHAPSPARFMFCSSISVAQGTKPERPVPEGPINDMKLASQMGYAQSKLVAEHIVNNAAACTGMDCCIFRVGQIVGDCQLGIWNDSEAIPLLIRSAKALGCLPKLEKSCSWLPVDSTAQIVKELAFDGKSSRNLANGVPCHGRFYNILNNREFSWNDDLLPELREAGLSFESVSPREWISRLEQSNQDPLRNPTVKLLRVYKKQYLDEGVTDGSSVNGNGHGVNCERQDIQFDTKASEGASETMRAPPDVIAEGLVRKFVARWLAKWATPILEEPAPS